MASGATTRFVDGETPGSDLKAANLNTIDIGGNVYQDPGGGLNVQITPVRGLINGVELIYAGTSSPQALTASQTNYIWLQSDGLHINTSGFPSYPGTRYWPLAAVVCGGSTITSFTDRRWKFYV